MKKAIALILTLCTLVCTLTACHSCRSNYLPKDTDTSPDGTETSENMKVPGIYPEDEDDVFIEHVWGTNPYEGMTPAELVDLYNDWYMPNYSGSNTANTPYYYIINSGYPGCRAFSKLTGEFCNLCKDPLCTHEKCIFCEDNSIVCIITAPDTDTLFMLIHNGSSDKVTLYSFTYQMDNAKALYTWSNYTDAPQRLYYYDHCLYYSGSYRHNNETVNKVYVMNLNTLEVSLLEGEDENKFRRMNLINGQYLYYTPENDSSLRRYDLKTGEDICVIPESIVLTEKGESGFDLIDVAPDNKMCRIQMWSNEGNHGSVKTNWYNMETGERTPGGDGFVCGEKTVFYKNHLSKDYQDDLFYMYYRNNEVVGGKENIPGGEIWVASKYGREEERLAYISTDGIPEQMDVGTNSFQTDGKCLYVFYSSYKGYLNEYNTIQINLEGEKNSIEPVGGFMILDVENCKTYCFGAPFDIAWYPDRAD